VTVESTDWEVARTVVRRSVRSSLHTSIASRNADGSIHVTPIGSLILTDVGRGFYFDVLNRTLACNVERDPQITILAVDSSRTMWLRSLLRARFVSPPGVRLEATAGELRRSRPDEIRAFQRVLGPLLFTRGGQKLWGRLPVVREVEVSSVGWLDLGDLTPN
jgi:hypothetical protein